MSRRLKSDIDYFFSVEWEEGNSGSYQGSSSLATTSYPGISHSQSDPAVIDWRHKGTDPPYYNVNIAVNAPPVPPLPQFFQMPRVESRTSGASSRDTSAFLTSRTSLAHLKHPSPPRSALYERVSIDEEVPEPDTEVHTAAGPENLERMPQLEEPAPQTRLLPDSVFTDGELESTTIEGGRTSASFRHPQPPPTPTDVVGNGKTDAVNTIRHAAFPAAS